MKNITLSADEELIEAARERARAEHTTLNEQFRRWLADYAGREQRLKQAMNLLDRLAATHTTGGEKFTRDEMNER
jgi:hypothetical protein